MYVAILSVETFMVVMDYGKKLWTKYRVSITCFKRIAPFFPCLIMSSTIRQSISIIGPQERKEEKEEVVIK